MQLRRCLLRLGLGLVWVWFVYWTCANVVTAPSAETAAAPPAFSMGTEIAVIVAAMIVAPWIVLGFRSGSE